MRNDLIALTAESLTMLSNLGLVKRAQKEIAGGVGPKIEETADGMVVASFRDGATTRLPRDAALKSTSCTCGSASVCRHRIAAVLAYQREQAANAVIAPMGPWDPGRFSDEALLSHCGAVSIERAHAALRRSFLVTTRAGVIPVALLPSSTVHFLVPHDLVFAKCDCTKGEACEHVALAVWAFRQRPDGGVIELGASDDSSSADALVRIEETLRAIAARGLADESITLELTTARAYADRAGLVWIVDALEDLERQKEAYERQSALFSPQTCALLVAEIAGRIRASRTTALPPRWILGSDEPRETLLDKVRLVSLGARIYADRERRLAKVFFADLESKSVLVLRKEWTFAEGDVPKNGHELGQLFASSKLSLAALAKGELISRAASRRANGTIDLSAARGLKTTVLPSMAAWDDLPAPILIRDLAKHEEFARTLPPSILRPRSIGTGVHVLAIRRVVEVSYRTAEQTLVGIVEDLAGHQVRIVTSHRTVSPGAITAVQLGLAQAPQFISGELTSTRKGWTLSPLAIVGAQNIVPDLEKATRQEEDLGPPSPPTLDTLASLMHDFDDLVDRGIHKGWLRVVSSTAPLSKKLRDVGLERIGLLLGSSSSEQSSHLINLAIVRALTHEGRFGLRSDGEPS